MKTLQLFTAVVSIFLISNIYSQPVTFDHSFGKEGKLVIPNTKVIIQFEFDKLGNIIAVGVTKGEDEKDYLTMVKTNPNGVIDKSFGNDGVVVLPFPNRYNFQYPWVYYYSFYHPMKMKIRNNNKIFITGDFFVEHLGENRRMFMQFNENGTFDCSFGNNGMIILDDSDFDIYSVNMESEDFFLLGGNAKLSNFPFISKYSYTGQLDETLGKNGKFYLIQKDTLYYPNCIKMLSDQTFLIAGDMHVLLLSYYVTDYFLKIDAQGNLITDFAGEGVNSKFFSCSSSVHSTISTGIIEDKSGDLTILGSSNIIGPYQLSYGISLRRLHYDGTGFEEFGEGNCFAYSKYPYQNSYISTIIQNEKHIFLGLGDRLINVSLNGILNPNFNNSGIFNCGFYFNDMKEQETNKFILGGCLNNNFVLAKIIIPEEVGLSETKSTQPNIEVYPNPASNVLRVTSNGLQVLGVEVYDMMGRKQKTNNTLSPYFNKAPLVAEEQKSRKAEEEVVIDISALQTGIYFVKIMTAQGEVVKKVVKL